MACDLVQQGLRSEAIELVEQKPLLLDLVQELDFSRHGEWIDLLQVQGMQTPPELLVPMAAALNTAYAELAELAPLLKKHRLLALARAPLAMRLQTVRLLGKKDPSSLCWIESIESYEEARIGEIAEELRPAIREKDLTTILALSKELQSSVWLITPPQDLRDRTAAAKKNLEGKDARQELEEMVAEIDAAHSELNEAKMLDLGTKWSHLAAIAQLSLQDPLAERVAPAIEWIAAQQKNHRDLRAFEKDVLRLEQILDQVSDRSTIQRAYDSVRRHNMPLPELLEERTLSRLESLELQRRRRVIAISAVSTVVVLGAIAAGSLAWLRSDHQAKISQHTVALSKLIEAGDTSAAQSYVGKIPATMRLAPKLSALTGQLETIVQAEHERAASFEEMITQAEAMDLAKPDHRLLAELSKIAETPEESQRLRRVKSALTQHAEANRRKDEAALGKKLSFWAKQLSELDTLLMNGQRMNATKAKTLVADVDFDVLSYPGVSISLKNRAELLVQKAQALVDYDNKVGLRHTDLDRIYSYVGSPSSFATALGSYAKSHQETPESKAISEIANDRAWRSVIDWNLYWDQYGRDLRKITPKHAQEMLTAGQLLLASPKHADNPLAKDFQLRSEHLKRVANRSESTESLRIGLRKPLLNMWVVQRKNGDVRYCIGKPKKNDEGRLQYEFYTNSTRSTRKTTSLEWQWFGQARHSAFCKQVEPTLSTLSAADWDLRFMKYLSALVRINEKNAVEAGPDVDPLIMLDLFHQLASAGTSGSVALEAALGDFNNQIDDAPIDFSAPWYIANDPRARQSQENALQLMPTSASLQAMLRAAKQEFDYQRRAPDSLSWVSAIDATRGINATLRPALESNATGELIIVTQHASKGPVFRTIGQATEGKFQLSLGVSLPTGTPVFLKAKQRNEEGT